jgi:type VI secretion system secreted protein Hcp
MPAPGPTPVIGGQHLGADMFLHVHSAKAGKIKGESTVPSNLEDILVHGWNWGLQANSAMGSTESLSRRSYSALTVLKRIDRATTGLMAALVQNALIKEAKLTMRRAGGDQQAYFVITLIGARISRLDHTTGADGTTVESVGISFTKLEVEYTPQQGTGLRGGSTSFADDLTPDS